VSGRTPRALSYFLAPRPVRPTLAAWDGGAVGGGDRVEKRGAGVLQTSLELAGAGDGLRQEGAALGQGCSDHERE